jgi:hypothetical protein
MCQQDVLDLRSRQWQPRNKLEGPKKISEVHQDAMRQQQQQEQRDREERRGGSMRRGDAPPSRNSNYGDRMLSRDEVPRQPLSLGSRQQSSELSLRPASGGAPGASFGKRSTAPGPPPASSRPSSVPREAPAPAAAAAAVPPPPPVATPPTLPEAAVRQKGKQGIMAAYQCQAPKLTSC